MTDREYVEGLSTAKLQKLISYAADELRKRVEEQRDRADKVSSTLAAVKNNG